MTVLARSSFVVAALLAMGVLASSALAAGTAPVVRALPLTFEPNLGQTDPRVKFLARGAGMTLFLTSTESVFLTRQRAVRMRMVGANPDPEIRGLDPLPGRTNSLIGRDRSRWRTNIPTFARVGYREVYPGIDLLYYSTPEQRLEYDFVVAPGADPARIRLAFEGVDRLEVDGAGGLVLHAGEARLRFAEPVVYQAAAGQRHRVAGAWALHDSSTVGVRLGGYDPTRPLVIDPVVEAATYYGGPAADQAFGIALGNDGSVFLTGNTVSATLPAVVGTVQPLPGGGVDAFVVKLGPSLDTIVYATFLGGSGDDAGRGIAVDAAGSAYVTGFTTSTDFPTTLAAFQPVRPAPQAAGVADAFVVQLDPLGATFIYSTYLGGTGSDVGLAIAVDILGSAYVTGGTFSVDFPVSPGALQGTLAGGRDAFVTRLGPGGALGIYSTYLGGAGTDVANAIALDVTGAAYVTGSTTCAVVPCVSPPDFPTTVGVFQPTRPAGQAAGVTDVFVTKLTAAGLLGYSTFLGGIAADEGLGVVVDVNTGTAFVTGGSSSANFPTTAGFPAFTGALQAFLAELAPTAQLVFSRPVPTSSVVTGLSRDTLPAAPSLAVGIGRDFDGLLYVAGSEIRAGAPQTDAFVMLFSGGGTNAEEFFVGGTGDDLGLALAVDLDGNAFLTGQTTSTTGLATAGAVQPALAGASDAYVAKVVGLREPTGGGGGGSGCLVATAAFGSPWSREVATLRVFRDRILRASVAGRALVKGYYRVSPPLARAVAEHEALRAVTRAALRPAIVGAGWALASPGITFVALAVAAAALAALLVHLALARWGARPGRRAVVVTFLATLGATLVAGALDSDDVRTRLVRGPGAVAERPATVPPRVVRRSGEIEPVAVERHEISGVRFTRWALAPGGARVRPTVHEGRLAYRIESDFVDGILTTEGFTVTAPKESEALGFAGGDRIVTINGHGAVGGAFASFILMQRDPDRNTLTIQLDRGGARLERAFVVR